MIIEGLEQGSSAWHEYRSSHIMGTDIPIILGSNPFKTKLELWEEKLGLRPPAGINSAMLRGQTLEPEARILVSELTGMQFEPVVIESDKYPWLAVSLDGYYHFNGGGKYIIEIKCPKELTHNQSRAGIIPEYYADQIQTQLLVSGAEFCLYCSYFPESHEVLAKIEVYPNHEKWEEIIAKGQEFYINMCTMNPPKEWELELRK